MDFIKRRRELNQEFINGKTCANKCPKNVICGGNMDTGFSYWYDDNIRIKCYRWLKNYPGSVWYKS